ncbi:MAG: glycosyltransferase family 9 protein [Microscillaceae bacterium]|nr:glycosyltransferase family 9 protein [Microscillaceae bacterium]
MKRILLSRTDNLGDVLLTLPLAGYLKAHWPEVELGFIGKAYTQGLVQACTHIGTFFDRESILHQPGLLTDFRADALVMVFPDEAVLRAAYQAQIPIRIATGHRWETWRYANRRVNFSRSRSKAHEAQLNFKLLKPLGLPTDVDLSQIPAWYGLQALAPLPSALARILQDARFKLVLHPKSKGSAREWGLENYYQLALGLPAQDFQIFVTGVAEEGEKVRQEKPELLALPHVMDVSGQLSLPELLRFLSECDGLLACSTGPLHIASALGKHTLGLFMPRRPMHPGRWQPVGRKAAYLVKEKDCYRCKGQNWCACIEEIRVEEVRAIIQTWPKGRE